MTKKLKHYQVLLTGKGSETKSDEFYAESLKEATQRMLTFLKESDEEWFDLHVEEII